MGSKVKAATYCHSHRLDVYGIDLYLAVDKPSWRRVRALVRELDKDIPSSAGMVQSWQVEETPIRARTTYVVWINLATSTDERDLVDTVAHEGLHAAWGILDDAGVTEKGNMEALAYLTGWITGWIWEGVNRNMKTAS